MPGTSNSTPVMGNRRRAVIALLGASALPRAWSQGWQSTQELRDEGLAALARFRDGMTAQRFAEVYEMLAPNMKQRPADLDDWLRRQRRFLASAGTLQKVEPGRTLWKEFADDADRAGIHLIAEYTGSYEKIARCYEVIILRRPPGGEFRVTVHQRTDVTARAAEQLRQERSRVWLLAATPSEADGRP